MACAFGRVGFRSSVSTITVTAAAEVHVSTPSAAVDWRISRPVAAEPGTGGGRGDDGFPMPSGPEFQATVGIGVFDGWARFPAGGGGAPEVVTGLSIVVGHEDVQSWSADTTRAGSVRWLDPPPAGWAAMCQVLFLPHIGGWSTCSPMWMRSWVASGPGRAMPCWSRPKQVVLDDRERAAVTVSGVGRSANRPRRWGRSDPEQWIVTPGGRWAPPCDLATTDRPGSPATVGSGRAIWRPRWRNGDDAVTGRHRDWCGCVPHTGLGGSLEIWFRQP
jgi:hypothetical protein